LINIKVTFSGVSYLNRTQVKLLHFLQLTQSLCTWLKVASLFNLPQKHHRIYGIPAQPWFPNQSEDQKPNLPSRLFQRKHAWYIYPESGFEARYERVTSF